LIQINKYNNKYFDWEICNFNKAANYWLNYLTKIDNISSLELGARNGDISMLFSDLNHSNIYCTDINKIHKKKLKENKHNKIKFKKIDVLNIDFPNSTFDVIGCKSLLGGICKKDTSNLDIATNEIYRVLKKNGIFIFAENIEGAFFHQIIRKYYKSSGWHYPKISNFLKSLEKFNKIEYETTGYLTMLTRNEQFKKRLFVIDELIKNCISKKSKYIIYGIAKK
tara:strand:+ start:389 stop:1060 length:672 start_codon:yes stop_codon:yes gene_type:complete